MQNKSKALPFTALCHCVSYESNSLTKDRTMSAKTC